MTHKGFVLALALFSSLGCNDEPDCALIAGFTGDFSGSAEWALTGEESCGLIDLPAAGGTPRSTIAFIKGSEYFLVGVNTPLLDIGTYFGQVTFVTTQGHIWTSGVSDCVVEISEFELEEWTQLNFISIQGTIECADPLTSATAGPLTVTNGAFRGHIYDKFVAFSGY